MVAKIDVYVRERAKQALFHPLWPFMPHAAVATLSPSTILLPHVGRCLPGATTVRRAPDASSHPLPPPVAP